MSKLATPDELYDMFVAPGATYQEIANMDRAEIARQVSEMRQDEPDDIQMTDDEIAAQIRSLAEANS